MTRYQKQQIFNKITTIFKSQKYIFVGRYDSSNYLTWKTFKNQHNIYIPKNKISKIVLEKLLSANIAINTKNLFQGPIFITWSNDSLHISKGISQLMGAGVLIYGGFIDKKLINFADTKELILLFESKNPSDLPFQRMYHHLYKPQQYLSGISQVFVSQLHQYAIASAKNKKNIV